MEGIIGLNGQQLTPEQVSKNNVKASVLEIEKFVFALGRITVPLQQAQPILNGCSFLQQMHDQLLAQLTPDDIEAMKKEVNKLSEAKPSDPAA